MGERASWNGKGPEKVFSRDKAIKNVGIKKIIDSIKRKRKKEKKNTNLVHDFFVILRHEYLFLIKGFHIV